MTFKVMAEPCATCIYRKDSPLDLKKLEDDVRDPYVGFKGHRICHHRDDACCRGFWNAHKDEFPAGQIAQRLNVVEFVTEQPLAEKGSDIMSNKHQLKREKRLARQSGIPGLSVEEIERMHGDNLAEVAQRIEEQRKRRQAEMRESIRQANARRAAAPKKEPRKAQPTQVLASAAPARFSFQAGGSTSVELTAAEEHVGTVQEGSLRAAIVEALSNGRGSMTIDELSALLKKDAKPVAAKLAQKGWLRIAK